MHIIKQFLSASVALVALFFVSVNISASEGPQKTREQMFDDAFNTEKTRIMSLPAYSAARDRFTQYLNDIEQFKAMKTQELRDDKIYQKNFADIKTELQRSGELCKHHSNLSNHEREHLVNVLTKQFIPQ
jgi:hypothetical protein